MKDIIKTNLKKMVNDGEGDMLRPLSPESIGGNAGHCKGLPCRCANFYYDKFNGEIKFFGNTQYVPEPIKQKFQQGALILALDKYLGRCVVKCYLDEATKTAISNLEETIKIYNKKYGFKL
jgi:hypothetical protein